MFWYILAGLCVIGFTWAYIKHNDWTYCGIMALTLVFLFMMNTIIWCSIKEQNEFNYVVQEIPCAAVDYNGSWYCGFEGNLEPQTPDRVVMSDAITEPHYVKQIHRIDHFFLLNWAIYQWDTYILVLPS